MGIRLGSTVINCADLEPMTDFWCAALDLTTNHREPGDEFRVLRGTPVNLSLQLAKTPVSARDQMHLDLYSDDPDPEVERLLALGARLVRRVEEPDDTYIVLLDPEGNEFCVCLVDTPLEET
jgi:catechol 2,3-dioxygenase-like lactoylglutathione lyase family enzyme